MSKMRVSQDGQKRLAILGGKDIVAKIVVFNSRAPHQKGVRRVKKLLRFCCTHWGFHYILLLILSKIYQWKISAWATL